MRLIQDRNEGWGGTEGKAGLMNLLQGRCGGKNGLGNIARTQKGNTEN